MASGKNQSIDSKTPADKTKIFLMQQSFVFQMDYNDHVFSAHSHLQVLLLVPME
jgi:hypothetical protein